MTSAALFEPLQLAAGLTLKNRIVMASLTRGRSSYTVPNDINVEYYKQRSSAGLIISEGVLIEPQGTEWPGAPGLFSKKHADAWRTVTKAVHENGGLMFAQLWHLGRVCHPLHQCGLPAVGPSSIPAKGGNFRLLASPNKDKPLGYVQHPEAIKDPKHYVQLFAKSAEYAKQAEFDGVELHCANGYLPNQFLDSNANKRTDEYGGSIENRCRFVLESVEALIKSFGSSKRVGIKLSPQGGYNDVGETEEEEKRLFEYLVVELDKMDIAYIQLSNSVFGSRNKLDITSLTPLIKNAKVFYNGNYTLESGLKHLNNGDKSADCIVYGRPYISNPDLVERFKNNLPLAKANWATVYANYDSDGQVKNAHVGYTDYLPAKQ